MKNKNLSRLFTGLVIGVLLLNLGLSNASAQITPPTLDWVRQFGTPGADLAHGGTVDSSGNYYMGGVAAGALPGSPFAGGINDMYLRKWDPSGNVVWTKEYGATTNTLGNDLNEEEFSDASGLYVGGWPAGLLTFPSDPQGVNCLPTPCTYQGNVDAYIQKLDFDGTRIWENEFGTFSATELGAGNRTGTDFVWAITGDDSFVYAAGMTGGVLISPDSVPQSYLGGTAGNQTDVFVAKVDKSTGTIIWIREFGTASGLGNGGDQGRGVAVDATGVYVSGFVGGALPGQTFSGGAADSFVRKYDLSGNVLWTNQFGSAGNDNARKMRVDSTGVYVTGMVGASLSGQPYVGGLDIFLRKYDVNGSEVWTRMFGTTGDERGEGIDLDSSSVYISGDVSTPGLPGLTYAGGTTDVFAAKYDKSGNQIWTTQLGTTGADTAQNTNGGINVFGSKIYIAGQTAGTFTGQVSAGGADAFVVSLTQILPGRSSASRIRNTFVTQDLSTTTGSRTLLWPGVNEEQSNQIGNLTFASTDQPPVEILQGDAQPQGVTAFVWKLLFGLKQFFMATIFSAYDDNIAYTGPGSTSYFIPPAPGDYHFSVTASFAQGGEDMNGSFTVTATGEAPHAAAPEASQEVTPAPIEVSAVPLPFGDVSEHWAYAYIKQLFDMKVVNGRTPTDFAPDAPLKRSEIVKVALLAFGYPVNDVVTRKPFKDVDIDVWYAKYVAAAEAAGIIDGYADRTFRPDMTITRVEALKILMAAAKKKVTTESASPFTDVRPSAWYAPYVNFSFQHEIMRGRTPTTFAPGKNVTRGEMAEAIVKLLQL